MTTRMDALSHNRETDTLARTIYGEARGESVRGKEAVAAVIINRVKRAQRRGHYWWGSTPELVCKRAWQFSCWNENDPNRAKIIQVKDNNKMFQTCLRVAHRAINGTLKDPTFGATHYHTKGSFPPWARGHAPRIEIGRHLFYVGIE